jgi:hypothetical protein
MFPHGRSLVEQYRHRPFVLLGVNAEPSRDGLKRVQDKERLPWRSWWDGSDGAIASHWGVDGFPTVFLIDHLGVVRYESHGRPDTEELDRKIEELVQEAETAEIRD